MMKNGYTGAILLCLFIRLTNIHFLFVSFEDTFLDAKAYNTKIFLLSSYNSRIVTGCSMPYFGNKV